ncbi:MAG: hypothetical protein M1818_003168 [Claussenomyces sp. TS43310]|nr:MAG: hypothetical protein M1818_003168 [Claussenomyces sp. TS43310]
MSSNDFENRKPTSAPKHPGVSLNVDTGYTGKPRGPSPPRTPNTPSPRAAKDNVNVASRAPRVRPATRGTFLDDITPVDYTRDNDMEGLRNSRDSHDLSISPRQVTRDSLVDNMLLSLDQYAVFGSAAADDEAHDYDALDDEQPYETYSQPRQTQVPGHNYSYSSDYDKPASTTRSSSRTTRERRSNSSSNFQTGLGRINSVRNESSGAATPTGQRGPQVQSRALHSRSGRGSKGSSTNSFELGHAQVSATQRWARANTGRSSSFDYGQDRQALNMDYATSRLNTDAARCSPYDYDAAPTPTVPVGPRRQMPLSSAAPISAERIPSPIPPTLERKRSTRSSKSAYKSRADLASGLGIDLGDDDTSRGLPPLPAFIKDPSPAPPGGAGKLSKDLQPAQVNASSQHTKDRPGFFRRVFGSSKNNLAAAPAAAAPEVTTSSQGSTTSNSISTDRSGGKQQHVAGQTKLAQPSSRDANSVAKDHAPPVLTKKPSSFFRRRKKSVSEPEHRPPIPVVPPIQVHATREDLMQMQLPSPVSSLRKVMNPYLGSPLKSPPDAQFTRENSNGRFEESARHDSDDLKGFSPDYTPDRNATIRAVKPRSRRSITDSPSSRNSLDLNDSDHGTTAALRIQSVNVKQDHDGMTLRDRRNNDREGKRTPLKVTSKIDRSTPEAIQRLVPSASIARDISLVAEYERAHSKRIFTVGRSENSTPEHATSTPAYLREEDWIMVTPSKSGHEKPSRVWLEPSSSEERLSAKVSNLSLAVEDAKTSAPTSGSTTTEYRSATSLPLVQIDADETGENNESNAELRSANEAVPSSSQAEAVVADAEDGARNAARSIYDGNENILPQSKAAAWLAGEGADRQRILRFYMEFYDFANLNILAALRVLCSRLILKGESQQIDRILDTFSGRWCQCNPNHGFKVADVVHTICYSILLLNTDLHMADVDSKMTRSQFVKNTMPTILRVVVDSAPGAFDRPSILPSKSQMLDKPSSGLSKTVDLTPSTGPASSDAERPRRASMKPPTRSNSDEPNSQLPTPLNFAPPVDDCGPLVKAPFYGTLRTWEVQLEVVLKDFYNSIRSERLPLFGAVSDKSQGQQSSQSNLSAFSNAMLRRTPSVISKAASEAQRGRTADTVRLGTGKWSTKNRSRARVYPSSALGSSRTSLDDQSSIWSPSASSSTWSKYSLGKTQASMSVDSFNSNWPQGDYQQSIGFANALSQAIIREETVHSSESNYSDELRVAPLLEDESLELSGAPWAKEGIVKHKHHLEALEKKAKDRGWSETFAVIEKGYMSLFSFSTKSMRNKNKGRAAGGVVGGGNWQDNAENLGSFLLRQTIASALPPPGYSKARPHVWALSLPTGAVHLFQVGTPEIVKEFVSTANYWSARLSNHPLVGGISNIEYGWSEAIVNNALVAAIHEGNTNHANPRSSINGARPSMQSSLRSSFDQGPGSIKAKLPGDRVMITDWTPPTQSMRASNLMEQDQLETLQAYVRSIEEELQKHNILRSSMLLAFTPRHTNAQKAMANWEKKSSYLLREIVKFQTYIDSLKAAEVQKQRVYTEREAHKAVQERNDGSSEDDDEGDLTLRPE